MMISETQKKQHSNAKMATTSEFTTGKSILILAVVIGCFAILWPKVFFPMMQAAFYTTKSSSSGGGGVGSVIDAGDQGHIRQERPPHATGPEVLHPALKERGNPFPTLERGKPPLITTIKGKPGPTSSLRPPMGGGGHGKTGSGKGPGAMSLLMPIYTVGIVVFFLYTISKVLLRKPNNEETPKVLGFHRDPEYRKYINNHDYGNGQPLTYKEYLKKKEEDDVKRTAKLLGDAGRKQVFTAIEGIIAEMDEYRERIMADQTMKTVTGEDDVEGHQIANGITSDSIRTTEGSENVKEEKEEAILVTLTVESDEKITKEKLEDELARISALSSDDTKIAVLGMETQVEFTEKPEKPNVDEVSNIVLERSVPSDTQLMVAESQSLTHTTTEHIDGWSDMDEQPVIVTGKMTISLLGKEASVHFAESKTSRDHQITNNKFKDSPPPISNATTTVNHAKISKEGKMDNIALHRKQIEELANALVDDILHNQVPKIFGQTKVSTPEVDDTFDTTTPFETRPRIPPRKQYSRESLNSQGSSFEYLSACQEVDLTHTPTAEQSPTSTSFNHGSEKDVEDFDNTNHVAQSNGRSSSNLNGFECVSIGSVSPLSPNTEGTYEKVLSGSMHDNGCEDGSIRQPTNWNSQDITYTENPQQYDVRVNNEHSHFKINYNSNGDTKDSVSTETLESERLTLHPTMELSTSRIQTDVEEEQKSAEEEEEDSRDTTPEADDVKRFA